jgi:hypothetical protein
MPPGSKLGRRKLGHRLTALSLGIALLGGANLAAQADGARQPPWGPEFSADIVSRDATGSVSEIGGRLYVGAGKVRIESPQAPAGFFLIDGASQRAWFVRSMQRVYTEARQSTPLTQIFIPVDPKNPCGEWQLAAEHAGTPGADAAWYCQRERSGKTTPPGQPIAYRIAVAAGNASERWIDEALAFTVKVRTPDGVTIALENIRVGAQASGLFALPAGYHELDPQALIDRIRHSDVWAAPEH